MFCKRCSKEFIQNQPFQIYCSNSCAQAYYREKNKTQNCLFCGTPTHNPKFCGHKCSHSHKLANGQIKFKQRTKKCKKCEALILSVWTYCRNCKPVKTKYIPDITLKEATYELHHKSSAFALVRSRARIVAKTHNLNTCKHCGYSRHVEIAHIKPIASYPEDTMLSEINDISNLIPLCPNCHWEFDHPKEAQTGLEPA